MPPAFGANPVMRIDARFPEPALVPRPYIPHPEPVEGRTAVRATRLSAMFELVRVA